MKNYSKSDLMINQSPVVFIDGLIGGGKTLISNLIGSIKDVDWWKYESKFEQLCSLNYLKKLNNEETSELIIKYYNEIYYDNYILRNSNFRKQDSSSIYNHPRAKKILRRLNYSDQQAKSNFKKAKIVLPFMTHFNTISSEPIFQAFGKKLVYVYLTRNPYNTYTINHLANWTEEWKKRKNRYGLLSVFDKFKNLNIPSFIYKYKRNYLRLNKFEKAILILKLFCDYQQKQKKLKRLKKKYNSKIIIIPYEDLTINPKKYLKILTKELNKKIDKVLVKSLKKNKLPRKSNYIPKGINNAHLFQYYWTKNNNREKLYTDEVKKFLKNKISKKFFLDISKLDKKYKQFLKSF